MATSKSEELELSSKMLGALTALAKVPRENLQLKTRAIAGAGENSYGLVLQVNLMPKTEAFSSVSECNYILKIAPKNPARRSHMRVADYYAREVFMYRYVFEEFRTLMAETADSDIDLMPKMLHYSLDECDEFIIFEDLTQTQYQVGHRTQLPSFEMAAMALSTIGKFHGLSFALQAKKLGRFGMLIAQLQPDNLFTPDIEPVSIEFGTSYIRRAKNMIQEDVSAQTSETKALENVERHFKHICLHCVDGYACAPYAVICHGDFWNNNILNKYDHNGTITSAKLVDFQMSRYASPILDIVHYLFVCTTYELRKSHFEQLLYEVYYAALDQQLQQFKLNASSIYPREIFWQQLLEYGAYGLCMAAFSLPFFIADATDLPDLDKVCEAIKDTETMTNANTTQSQKETECHDSKNSRLRLIEDEFNLLTQRTAAIFKIRMAGVVADIVKYGIKTEVEA